MAKVKTTVPPDKQLLKQFKKSVASKYGTSRMLSSESEEALRAFSPLEVIRSLAARLHVTIEQYPSLDEVSRDRRRIKVSAGKVLREMCDERARRTLGSTQHRDR